MTYTMQPVLVLAIHPMPAGFGYVLMTSPDSPVDFGTKTARRGNKNKLSFDAIVALINAHHPEAIVLEDPTASGTRRPKRIEDLVRMVAQYAQDQMLDVSVFPRATVRECFENADARTRYEIAVVIAQRNPAFERFLPATRHRWDSEHPNMSIFAAAALALTYFHIWER